MKSLVPAIEGFSPSNLPLRKPEKIGYVTLFNAITLGIKLSKKESHLRLNITKKLCEIPAPPRPLHAPERDGHSEKCESVFFF